MERYPRPDTCLCGEWICIRNHLTLTLRPADNTQYHFATESAEGEEWMTSPPHIMLIMPGDLVEAGFSPDFQSGAPWIMYAGTPYEHIMMPVTEGVMGDMGDMGDMAMATPYA